MKKTAIVSIIALVLVGCSKPKLDMGKVEEAVKTSVKSAEQEAKSVSCPKEMDQKEGNNFECTGETNNGHKFTSKVTQKDDDGKIGVVSTAQ